MPTVLNARYGFAFRLLSAALCIGTSVAYAEETQVAERFAIRGNEEETLTLAEMAECEATSYLFADLINAYLKSGKKVPEIDGQVRDQKRAALISAGAYTWLLNELQQQDSEGLVKRSRDEATQAASTALTSFTEKLSNYKSPYQSSEEDELYSIQLTFEYGVQSISFLACEQNLIIFSPARDLLSDPQQETQSATRQTEVTSSDDVAEQDPWTVGSEKSEMTDQTNVYLTTQAVGSRNPAAGIDREPTLILRCMENKTAVIIDMGGAFMSDIENYGEVEVRLDEEPKKVIQMFATTDNMAIGLGSGMNAIGFIKGLFDAQELRLRVTPYRESGAIIRFNITGLKQKIDPLRTECGW